MIQQSKINGFIKSITDVADEKKAKLDAETRDILAGERRQLELAAKKSADEYYRVRSARVKLEAVAVSPTPPPSTASRSLPAGARSSGRCSRALPRG